MNRKSEATSDCYRSHIAGRLVLNNEWEWIKDELGIGSGNVESGLVHDVKGNDDHLRILGTHVDPYNTLYFPNVTASKNYLDI